YSLRDSDDSSFTSPHSIVPALMRSSPFRHLNSVVFPHSDPPMIPMTLCGGTSNVMPRSTSLSPNLFRRLLARIMLQPPMVLPPPLGAQNDRGVAVPADARRGPSASSSRDRTATRRHRETETDRTRLPVLDTRLRAPKQKSRTLPTCL